MASQRRRGRSDDVRLLARIVLKQFGTKPWTTRDLREQANFHTIPGGVLTYMHMDGAIRRSPEKRVHLENGYVSSWILTEKGKKIANAQW